LIIVGASLFTLVIDKGGQVYGGGAVSEHLACRRWHRCSDRKENPLLFTVSEILLLFGREIDVGLE
jgi:hypothetical protein